jgi:hypothetical protein
MWLSKQSKKAPAIPQPCQGEIFISVFMSENGAIPGCNMVMKKNVWFNKRQPEVVKEIILHLPCACARKLQTLSLEASVGLHCTKLLFRDKGKLLVDLPTENGLLWPSQPRLSTCPY